MSMKSSIHSTIYYANILCQYTMIQFKIVIDTSCMAYRAINRNQRAETTSCQRFRR